MKKMTKQIISLATVFAIVTTGLTACNKKADTSSTASDSSSASATTLVIGGTGPLTGDASTYGISVRNGAQVAVDEINAAGGINGVQIKFLFQDDEADGTKAKACFDKLMDDGMQIYMGAVTSGASIALNDTIKQEGILQISPSASNPQVLGNPNTFRICFDDAYQAQAMAEYAYNTLKYTKVAYLYNQDDSYSTGLYDAFKAKWKTLGGTVSADASFSKDAKDFNAQLTKIGSSDAQFIFLPIYAEKASQIAITANEKNVKLPIIGCDGLDGILNYLKGDNTKLVEGLIYSTPFFSSDPTDLVKNFVAKFKEKNGTEPDQFAADAYDAIYSIKAAIEKAGLSADDMKLDAKALGAKLVPVMTQIQVNGLTGNMTFSASGAPTKTMRIAEIKDGKYTVKK